MVRCVVNFQLGRGSTQFRAVGCRAVVDRKIKFPGPFKISMPGEVSLSLTSLLVTPGHVPWNFIELSTRTLMSGVNRRRKALHEHAFNNECI